MLAGGDVLSGGLNDQGAYVTPTIDDLPATHGINKDELFLPLPSVLTFSDLAASIADGTTFNTG